ncbi:choline dehydrogenase [Cavenderia fasciculata]|uniref:Choline dehydrogenase n=1 Tax=Cavenderia fasciculata TaxID=261658 RepID=F4PNN0_CACFS|nr:choline dehydrogenase [Cavenderia fasciculata]EGG23083.1 choline dehydrogenase [Cavenderia fasciculata]|eukprot:XP_004360934.1 choline dehydrogenase [Cavenderia fasciculata]
MAIISKLVATAFSLFMLLALLLLNNYQLVNAQITATISVGSSSLFLVYDFIVVGSGSSGSIITDRLSEKGYSVLVLEAGKKSIAGLGGEDYVGTRGTLNPKNNEYTANRPVTAFDVPLYWQKASITGPRWDIQGAQVAKMIGGCGVHNGMVFQRGKTDDYDDWGVPGWNWTTMEPYFKKVYTIMDSHLVSSNKHGHQGKIKVGTRPFDQEGRNFLLSCNSSGLPYNNDFNGNEFRDGCGYWQFNINDKGERSTPAHEYLTNATKRQNVQLLTSVTVLRVRWRYNIILAKYEASGVEFILTNNPTQVYYIQCAKEVILTAGALNTPKILMNSGVGDAAQLAQYTQHIPTLIKHLPGVGRNLLNHFLIFTIHHYNDTSDERPTMYDLFGIDLQYSTMGTGIFATPGYSVGAWLRPNGTGGEAENVMLIQPGVIGQSVPFKAISMAISISKPQPNNHYLTLNTNQTGSRIDFFQRPPLLNFTLLNKQQDIDTLVRGFKEARRILSHPPMSNYVAQVVPPANVVSDADIEDFVKSSAVSHEHWSGTAKMGTEFDPMAVVDNKLRVIGVRGLRVCDASVFPKLPHSLIHATVMTVAEKAADIIIDDYDLFN